MRSSTDPPLKFADTTNQIIGAFFTVYNALGPGLAEKVYERALTLELGRRGCDVSTQSSLSIRYGQVKVGRFRADLVVDGKVLVEIKARSHILKDTGPNSSTTSPSVASKLGCC